MTRSYDAVVLAGGAARRLGGADKPALPVGGRMLLDRVLAACPGARATVVVGPRRPTSRPVRWTREDPAGGGPLPALAAGLAALPGTGGARQPVGDGDGDAGHEDGLRRGDADRDGNGGGNRGGDGDADADRVVLVFAADLPFLTERTAVALVRALDADAAGAAEGAPWEGAVLTDSGGRDQPLAAAYRVEPLRREIALLRAEHGHLTGLPLRFLTGELRLCRIADPTGEASFDCDTWEDVAAARARFGAGAAGPDGSGR
ncbi:NTP transferase domain-containing protein [Streptomyces sp. V4-01]|uniref:NTP transferase domain-containing protein n=1 Tax=Actinacidiphila polyblastidii TaxID=3110430 RepID=A0ABU7PHK6_9ACTN|nr:NTP transferase domain-containing protein [Streptomyces sp. V4-01]